MLLVYEYKQCNNFLHALKAKFYYKTILPNQVFCRKKHLLIRPKRKGNLKSRAGRLLLEGQKKTPNIDLCHTKAI